MRTRTPRILWAPALAVVLLLFGLIPGAQAQQASSAGWTLTKLDGPVTWLSTPASGALFAEVPFGLIFRSDDGGVTWRLVSLPDSASTVEVDPTDHTILYAAAPDGLYKSADDAASWTLILPTTEQVRELAVSPADHNLIFAGLAPASGSGTEIRFVRSRDGGATWEQTEQYHNSLCSWGIFLLVPHPTDASRVFRTAGCYAGRNMGDDLTLSADQGATWSRLFSPDTAYPAHLVGGQGSDSARFYLAANRDGRVGGSSLYRSDDDGQTWTDVLAYRGGGFVQDPGLPEVMITGLAYDPSAPDHVYVGLMTTTKVGNVLQRTGTVKTSTDGGATWTPLGDDNLGTIYDVKLGVDGRNLYAATDQGVWQHAVGNPAR